MIKLKTFETFLEWQPCHFLYCSVTLSTSIIFPNIYANPWIQCLLVLGWGVFFTKELCIYSQIGSFDCLKFVNNSVKIKPNAVIKNKLNLRRRLLSKFKNLPTPELKMRIKNLSIEIKKHFYSIKQSNVQRLIKPGCSKSLWQAVKAAKDIGISSLPQIMTFKNSDVTGNERSECFARFFSEKINSITSNLVVDSEVYNGKRKIYRRFSCRCRVDLS